MPCDTFYDFDTFRLIPQQRMLLAHGRPVKIGSRAFDRLVLLVQQHQRTVSKQELLDAVWPDDVVNEANLAVHLMALRKALGRAAIATHAGRGYRFTRSVVQAPPANALSASTPQAPAATAVRINLPTSDGPLPGRKSEPEELLTHLDAPGLVTLLGGAGFGKTRLAQEVARATPAGPVLLVLDNAGHVLEGVIALLALLTLLQRQAPAATLLVTTQGLLRVPGEHVMRLGPLSLPGDDSLDAARRSGAVALFEARARQLEARFSLDDGRHLAVIDVCRRLDGVPLAIELAAARLPLLGLSGVQASAWRRMSASAPGKSSTSRARWSTRRWWLPRGIRSRAFAFSRARVSTRSSAFRRLRQRVDDHLGLAVGRDLPVLARGALAGFAPPVLRSKDQQAAAWVREREVGVRRPRAGTSVAKGLFPPPQGNKRCASVTTSTTAGSPCW